MTPGIERRFPADARALREIRGFVGDVAQRQSFTSERWDIQLAVTEACANAIRHSNSDSVVVRVACEDRRIVVEVQDDGVFRRGLRVPEVDGEGQRGIPLIMAVMDEVTIREGTPASPGTLVRLVKRKTN